MGESQSFLSRSVTENVPTRSASKWVVDSLACAACLYLREIHPPIVQETAKRSSQLDGIELRYFLWCRRRLPF